MNVSFIGAGNLATNLAVAFKNAGFSVPSVFSRTIESAKCLAERVGACPTTSLESLNRNSDIYIIAVKDDVIHEIATKLSELIPEALLVHTSGSTPINAIPSSRKGVFYPMQTFSKNRIVDFSHIPIFIESNNKTDEIKLKKTAEIFSRSVFIADGKRRQALHLSAVFCCNFANHCAAIANEILDKYNLPFEVMLPLINETNAKINLSSPVKSQTGPAVRNDQSVIKSHLDLLKQMNEPLWKDIYKLISKSILELSNR